MRYQSRKDDSHLVNRLTDLAATHPRYGVRRLWWLVRQAGVKVNLKRVRRLCRKHGLLLKARKRRKRRGMGVGMPCRANWPNHVWSYDFVEDRTESGRKLRILTVVDEFTRRCMRLEVEHRMNAKYVAQTLLGLFQEHGTPVFVRSDNGPEFIARFLMRVLAIQGVAVRHIDPGSPWQNGIDERFNGTLRDECLNLETFHGRDQARALIKLFGREYNQHRPHSSLGMQTPEAFYERWKQTHDGCAGGEQPGRCPDAEPSAPLPQDLTLGAPDGLVKESGLAEACSNQPDRPVIHVGAPVASQQSRILRVDAMSVAEPVPTGMFPTDDQQPGLES